ncbi:hypothetical protein ACTFIV_005730 [Dictyostelium citrinum]
MNNFLILFLIFLFFNISLSSKEINGDNNIEINGFFRYKIIEGTNKIQFKKLSYSENKYQIEKESITISQKEMNFQYLVDNQKLSIIKATIKNCCSHYNFNNCLIEIKEIYQPIPSGISNKIIEKIINSPNSDSFQYYKFKYNEELSLNYDNKNNNNNNDDDGKNIKIFKSIRTNKLISLDFNSMQSPYRYLSGFDNKWYDSDIGLNNTIYLFKLKSHGSYNQPNKYNHIYYNQKLLLIYSKVEFCYSQFPEPSGYDPYFIVKRNRIDNTTKCSPPTGVVIALNCKYTPIPQCQYGLSLISYNDPHLYCPIYSCDLPINYYS